MTLYRVRRGPILAFTLFVGVVLYLLSPWRMFGSYEGKKEVDELYGLLHLATASDPVNERVLGNPRLDLWSPLEWNTYSSNAPGINWHKEAKRIDTKHPIIVFSKSYCPYSRRAKELLKTYHISPAPKIVEVDLREDGAAIKTLLTRLTGHSTFPNVIVRGKSIGGSDNLAALHSENELRGIIERAGATVKKVDA